MLLLMECDYWKLLINNGREVMEYNEIKHKNENSLFIPWTVPSYNNRDIVECNGIQWTIKVNNSNYWDKIVLATMANGKKWTNDVKTHPPKKREKTTGILIPDSWILMGYNG